MTTAPPAPPARRPGWFRLLTLSHPFWDRTAGHRLGRRLLFGLYLYLGALAVLLALENRFLYLPSRADEYWLPPPPALDARDVELTSRDGTRLHGWWCEPPGWTPEQGAMLYSHGNAGNLSIRGEAVLLWVREMGTAVLIYDYPGYGRSAGTPSEAGLYAAGDAAYDWVTGVQKVPPEKLFLYGGSLGGAVATELASRRPCRAVVLVAAFSSFPDMAQKTFPWLPARWLVRNRLDNVARLPAIHVPVFIAHGTADTLVPASQAEKLYAAANEPKYLHRMVGHDHNLGPDREMYAALRTFLAEAEKQ